MNLIQTHSHMFTCFFFFALVRFQYLSRLKIVIDFQRLFNKEYTSLEYIHFSAMFRWLLEVFLLGPLIHRLALLLVLRLKTFLHVDECRHVWVKTSGFPILPRHIVIGMVSFIFQVKHKKSYCVSDSEWSMPLCLLIFSFLHWFFLDHFSRFC